MDVPRGFFVDNDNRLTVVGTVVLMVWKAVGLGEYLYEIVPGFAANCLVICIVNIFVGQDDEAVLAGFDQIAGDRRWDKE
jgi:hypothetical protein